MAVPYGQRAAVADPRAAAIGIHVAEYQRAGSRLGQAADAADAIGDRQAVHAIEGQRGVIGYVAAAQRADGATVAHLQGTGVNNRASRIAVRPNEYHRAGAGLGQATAAA